MSGPVVWLQSALVALFCFMALPLPAGAADFATEPLEIHRQDGSTLMLTVELAVDSDQRQQGLMNRKTMAADHGMLFDFGRTRPVLMWMKDTLLPLDMLFITGDGRISHIQPDTVPMSEAIIDSRGPVRFVLELNGGAAARMNIRLGDSVKSGQITRAGQTP
jgi:uncharacterized membrane protein (UPF0127 family)